MTRASRGARAGFRGRHLWIPEASSNPVSLFPARQAKSRHQKIADLPPCRPEREVEQPRPPVPYVNEQGSKHCGVTAMQIIAGHLKAQGGNENHKGNGANGTCFREHFDQPIMGVRGNDVEIVSGHPRIGAGQEIDRVNAVAEPGRIHAAP